MQESSGAWGICQRPELPFGSHSANKYAIFWTNGTEKAFVVNVHFICEDFLFFYFFFPSKKSEVDPFFFLTFLSVLIGDNFFVFLFGLLWEISLFFQRSLRWIKFFTFFCYICWTLFSHLRTSSTGPQKSCKQWTHTNSWEKQTETVRTIHVFSVCNGDGLTVGLLLPFSFKSIYQ